MKKPTDNDYIYIYIYIGLCKHHLLNIICMYVHKTPKNNTLKIHKTDEKKN